MDVRSRRRRDRRKWRNAYLVSLVLHAVVLLPGGHRPVPSAPFSAAGPQSDDALAAGGAMQTISIAAPPVQPVARPRAPVPIEIDIEPPTLEVDPAFDLTAPIGERPGLEDPGLANGIGSGAGGAADEGLGRLLPPSPRGMIIPPANRDLRGVEIDVWVLVDAAGRVVADSTRLDPPTRDRGFNRQLIREAAQWVFRPGSKDGQPLAAWFVYKISL